MAGSNRRGQLSEFKHAAITARQELNPQLHVGEHGTYFVTQDDKKQYLSNTLEGERFALECRCGRDHVRWATLHSILQPYDLFCQWCECETEGWRGIGKDPVSAAEKEAMEALQSAGLDHTTACQVVLPFWSGRLDFFHITSETAIQADGSSHFMCMHHRAPQFQLLSDIECCTRAWREGVQLLRVHHKYARSKEAMIIATQLPYAHFVMLAGGYESVVVWHQGRHCSYMDMLKDRLRGARYLQMGVPGCVIFY